MEVISKSYYLTLTTIEVMNQMSKDQERSRNNYVKRLIDNAIVGDYIIEPSEEKEKGRSITLFMPDYCHEYIEKIAKRYNVKPSKILNKIIFK